MTFFMELRLTQLAQSPEVKDWHFKFFSFFTFDGHFCPSLKDAGLVFLVLGNAAESVVDTVMAGK